MADEKKKTTGTTAGITKPSKSGAKHKSDADNTEGASQQQTGGGAVSYPQNTMQIVQGNFPQQAIWPSQHAQGVIYMTAAPTTANNQLGQQQPVVVSQQSQQGNAQSVPMIAKLEGNYEVPTYLVAGPPPFCEKSLRLYEDKK